MISSRSHARRVWKENPAAAEPFFQKALLAGNSYVSQMAKDSLEGKGHERAHRSECGEEVYFRSVKASIGDETNPQNLLLANQTAASSFAALQGTGGCSPVSAVRELSPPTTPFRVTSISSSPKTIFCSRIWRFLSFSRPGPTRIFG